MTEPTTPELSPLERARQILAEPEVAAVVAAELADRAAGAVPDTGRDREPQHNHLNSGIYACCPACGTDWEYSRGGLVGRPVPVALKVGERVWRQDGSTYEWTGLRFVQVDDEANPWKIDTEETGELRGSTGERDDA